YGPNAQDPASLFALGRADGRSFFVRFACDSPLSPCQINNRHPMTGFRISSQGSGTTGFGIVRMAANAGDSERPCRPASGLLSLQRKSYSAEPKTVQACLINCRRVNSG